MVSYRSLQAIPEAHELTWSPHPSADKCRHIAAVQERVHDAAAAHVRPIHVASSENRDCANIPLLTICCLRLFVVVYKHVIL